MESEACFDSLKTWNLIIIASLFSIECLIDGVFTNPRPQSNEGLYQCWYSRHSSRLMQCFVRNRSKGNFESCKIYSIREWKTVNKPYSHFWESDIVVPSWKLMCKIKYKQPNQSYALKWYFYAFSTRCCKINQCVQKSSSELELQQIDRCRFFTAISFNTLCILFSQRMDELSSNSD